MVFLPGGLPCRMVHAMRFCWCFLSRPGAARTRWVFYWPFGRENFGEQVIPSAGRHRPRGVSGARPARGQFPLVAERRRSPARLKRDFNRCARAQSR